MIKKRIRLSKEKRNNISRELHTIVGKERVTSNPGILYTYSGTSMVLPKAMPDFVVQPKKVDEIVKIVALCRKYKIPVTPVASGSQEPSTYPFFGGIVLDTMAMDTIVEINQDDAYAVLEPGVTIGTFSDALDKIGMRCAVGSFPPGISTIGNYTMTAVNSFRSSGIIDDVLGLEAVLPDGTIVHTGSKAFSHTYPETGWFSTTNSFPNLRSLFIDANATLGVITKAAVRIYPKNEVQELPISAFEDYSSALEYMKRLSRGNLVQHVCAWHWTLYTIIDHLGQYGRGSPADVLIYDPWEKPDERPYILVVPSMSGYREVMDAHLKVCERLTKELGGRPFTSECQKQFPGAWKFFSDHYRDHRPTDQFMGGYGEGFPVMPIVFASSDKVSKLEEWGLKFLRNSPLKLGLSYYSHSVDQARSIFLRFTPFISPDSTDEEIEEAKKVRWQYLDAAYKRYGAVPIRFDYGRGAGNILRQTGGHGKLLRTIKKAIDPDNIMNSGMSVEMYGLDQE